MRAEYFNMNEDYPSFCLSFRDAERELARDILEKAVSEYNKLYDLDKTITEGYKSFYVPLTGRKEYRIFVEIYLIYKAEFYAKYRY